jgi:hypothetical protein
MDRELLELAAKAAGIEIHSYDPISDRIYTPRSLPMLEGSYLHTWNPLTDDGDALRLAVQLQIIVGRYDNYVNAAPLHDGAKEIVIWSHNEKDPYAATRRAITRAAAEIGRSMK